MPILPFSKLPKEARMALYVFEHGLKGGDSIDPRDQDFEDLRDYEREMNERGAKFGYDFVPLGLLVREVMRKHSEIGREFKDFESYHEDYAAAQRYGGHWPPAWAKIDPSTMFPLILQGKPGGPYYDSSGEGYTQVIDDGWHRFHFYYEKYGPRKLIPVLWYPIVKNRR